MEFTHKYPAEYFLNPIQCGLGGEDLENFQKIYFTLLDDFDTFHMFMERRIIQDTPDNYWKYIYLGRFGDDEGIKKFIAGIVERFKKINADCKYFRQVDLFCDPEDVVSSYFLRDVMMTFLPREQAYKVCDKKDVIFNEFKLSKESPTLRNLIGEEKYGEIMKNYKK